MQGEIVFTSYKNVDNVDCSVFNHQLQIVRYTKQGLRDGFTHFPLFAPSEKLYSTAMYRWKKLKFTPEEKKKMAEGKTGTWYDLYEEAFLNEKRKDKQFIQTYYQIIEKVKHGETFLMVCYCDNYDRCHRKIVADIFALAGVPVRNI